MSILESIKNIEFKSTYSQHGHYLKYIVGATLIPILDYSIVLGMSIVTILFLGYFIGMIVLRQKDMYLNMFPGKAFISGKENKPHKYRLTVTLFGIMAFFSGLLLITQIFI